MSRVCELFFTTLGLSVPRVSGEAAETAFPGCSGSATLTENHKSHVDDGQRESWKKIKSLLKCDKKVMPAQEKRVKMRLLALKTLLRFPCEFQFSI